MKHLWMTIFVLFLVLAGAISWLIGKEEPRRSGEEGLVVHCAAGFLKPMTEIARQYEEEFGVVVQLQFGGSGALASQLEIAGGDLFFPADESFLAPLRERGGLLESFEVTRLTAGLVVAKGNPRELGQLRDLTRGALKISLGEKSASIGKHTWQILEEEGIWLEIQPNVVVTKPTVNAIVEDVAMGAVDVAIAWDAVARNYPEVEWIAVPEFSRNARRADLGVLKTSEQPKEALRFARYVVALDRGWKVFEKMGFARPDF